MNSDRGENRHQYRPETNTDVNTNKDRQYTIQTSWKRTQATKQAQTDGDEHKHL